MEGSIDGPHGVLLLDKPAGITSTRALAIAKRAIKPSRAGHTGTLDPFATGLLPLVFGEATKFSRFLIDARKSYRATLRLGEETDTGDPEGAVIARSESRPSTPAIDAVLATFVGCADQRPPMHSAVHVRGRRLYEYAREGIVVERTARRIEIYDLRRLAFDGNELVLEVSCSKGTYVRVLAADIGRALGCGASLSALRRTATGPFRLEDAVPLLQVESGGADWTTGRLLPPETLVAGLPWFETPAEVASRFLHGQAIEGPAGPPGAEVALFGPGRQFLGVGRIEHGPRLAPVRLVSQALAQIP